jgi:ATP-dependent RNA helicase RhlE
MMQFSQLGLSEPILRAVHVAGYTQTTPIQAKAIPPVLEGHDLLGCAQTGTGKTAAFSLPILHRLADTQSEQPASAAAPPQAQPGNRNGKRQGTRAASRPIRALIVTPTRELAAQIGDSLRTYGKYLPLRSAVIFGGVSQVPQVDALHRGIDILVATPGRLLDLINQGHVHLDRVEVLVLDEADRMLDMGFILDIRKIIARVPAERQTLLFSATMPPEIRELADGLLDEPVRVAVSPETVAAETVTHRVYLVERDDKQPLLTHLLRDASMTRALVFTRTKHGADRVVKRLERDEIDAVAIHGNKSQNARLRALDSFKSGRTRVLVASDIAARGLDIDEVSHVINFDLPNEPETYVHRIGRTGRAGATGTAVSFCASEERGFLRSIERTIGMSLPVEADQPFHATFRKMDVPEPAPGRGGRPGNRTGVREGGRGGRPGHTPRQQRPSHAQARPARTENGEHGARTEGTARPARSEHIDRIARAEMAGRSARAMRTERIARTEPGHAEPSRPAQRTTSTRRRDR